MNVTEDRRQAGVAARTVNRVGQSTVRLGGPGFSEAVRNVVREKGRVDLSLEEFIYQVKRELLDAQAKHACEPGYFSLKSVELTATIAVKPSADLGVSIKVLAVGAKIDREHTHQVKLTFDISETAPPEEAKNLATKGPSSGGGRSVRVGGKKYR